MNLTVSVKPTIEPVSVADVLAWSRIDDSGEAAEIERLIKRVREHVEGMLNRALLTQTLVARYDCFPRCFELRAPAVSVTGLQYIDQAGVTQTVSASNYWTDFYSEPGRLVPTWSYSWPSTQDGRPNSVILTYVAGWTAADLVPEPIRMGILMLADHWFENRGAIAAGGALPDVPVAVRNILWPYLIP